MKNQIAKKTCVIMLLGFFGLQSKIGKCQTVLVPGDILVIGFKTNNGTQTANDAIKLLTLVELVCGTKFTVTDNNYNSSTPGWPCNDNEFAVEITCNNLIPAGSVFYIDVDGSAGGPASCSGGSITRVDLNSAAADWGNDWGLSGSGDNIYVLQGTRAVPKFISAIKQTAFANNTGCDKQDAGLPTHASLGSYTLSVGFSAVVMANSANQWHLNCAVAANTSGTKSDLRSRITNNSNWTSGNGQTWSNATCTFSVTDAPFVPSGAIGISGAGCGCESGCDLTAVGGPNCTGVTGNCARQNMSKDIVVPVGCTYTVTATMRSWPFQGCSSGSGQDTPDQLKVDAIAGVKPFITGVNNDNKIDSYVMIGPGTIRVSGSADRADEIIAYKINTSSCASCGLFILPVELTKFNATLQNNMVELKWATASETNNDFFTIERSQDAAYWETISIVKSIEDSKSDQTLYSILDSYPLPGISYYRLKQTDKNARYSHSQIVTVDNEIKEHKIIKRINIYGEDVNENATGLLILIYENGTVKKVYK